MCQLLESFFRLLDYIKRNQETFKIINYKIHKLKSIYILVYHKLGEVTMYYYY
jgi:hypothetical protein